MLKLLWVRPCLHCTLPNFALDAMLKLTGIEIDLMNDQEMHEMIKSGLRGEMTQTNGKKVEANDKDMGADCDKNKEISYITI